MSKLISLVINADTRSGFNKSESSAEIMLEGCRSIDFLIEGIKNKQKFFSGFDIETILYIDEHEPIPENVLNEIRSIVTTLVIKKHSKRYRDMVYCHNFNDFHYLSALFMANGEIVFHADQDTACFTSNKESVQEMISMLDEHKFVSYPSHWTPNAITDPSFEGRTWASTRFFFCKRETLKFDTIIQCILNPDWAYKTFGDSPRKMNWLEHFLTLTNDNSAYYPPINLDKLAVFSWSKYITGTLGKLNAMNYGEVKNYIDRCGGICYPNDVQGREV